MECSQLDKSALCMKSQDLIPNEPTTSFEIFCKWVSSTYMNENKDSLPPSTFIVKYDSALVPWGYARPGTSPDINIDCKLSFDGHPIFFSALKVSSFSGVYLSSVLEE